MVNVGLNVGSLLGIVLVLLGLLLIVMVVIQPFQVNRLIQNLVLALVYLLTGAILFLQGWRLEPVLQFAQFFLIGSTIYWVVKDIFYRS